MNKVTIYQGASGCWYVRENEVLKAGFFDRDDAELFVNAKWPESQQKD